MSCSGRTAHHPSWHTARQVSVCLSFKRILAKFFKCSPQMMGQIAFKLDFKAMFTRDRSQMDPTLSWNGPFLFTRYRSASLSTSVHTGPVCYGSVLNRSKKSSCFYQLNMRRIHAEAFKMAPKKSNCAASPIRNRSRCLLGDRSIWDRNGSKTGPAILEVQLSDDLIGNGFTVR